MRFLSIFSSLLLVACLLSFTFPGTCFAENKVKVTPVVIDQKVKPRDLLEFSIHLKNEGEKKVSLYPIVNDISVEEGRQEFLDPTLLSKTSSLARWVRISRGVIDLWPGEETDVPLSIEVGPQAEPGNYHAVISFAHGSNQEEAKSQAQKLNQPQLILNIEVKEHIVEKAQIKRFQTSKNLFLEFPVNFLLEIENIGNRKVSPEGFIYIYNKRGEEVGLVPVNENLGAISPLADKLFNSFWEPEGGLGQYKARLVVEYGNQGKKLQDTVYFWVLPREFLLFFGGGLVFTALLLLWISSNRRKKETSQESSSNITTIDLSSR